LGFAWPPPPPAAQAGYAIMQMKSRTTMAGIYQAMRIVFRINDRYI
jgi:hypothetical protein